MLGRFVIYLYTFEGRVHYYNNNNYVYVMLSNKCILLVRMVYIYTLASCGEGWDRCHGYVCSNCVGKCD